MVHLYGTVWLTVTFLILAAILALVGFLNRSGLKNGELFANILIAGVIVFWFGTALYTFFRLW